MCKAPRRITFQMGKVNITSFRLRANLDQLSLLGQCVEVRTKWPHAGEHNARVKDAVYLQAKQGAGPGLDGKEE